MTVFRPDRELIPVGGDIKMSQSIDGKKVREVVIDFENGPTRTTTITFIIWRAFQDDDATVCDPESGERLEPSDVFEFE